MNELVEFIKSIVNLEDISEIRRLCCDALLRNMADAATRLIYGEEGRLFRISMTDHDVLQGLILRGYSEQGANNGKIEAIKRLRAMTGWGLRETKYAVENATNFNQPKRD